MRKVKIIVLAFFAIAVGLYPLVYFIFDMGTQGFLSGKPAELLESTAWSGAFYTHIIFGGLSLLLGWSQFSKKLRSRYLRMHRKLGILYLACVMLSGVAGFYLAVFANGGIVGKLGFSLLAIGWLYTTFVAFLAVKRGNISSHERWMIRSYALTFAAVTLRFWLPVLGMIFHMEFESSYKLVSWLCWVPNLIFAEILIRRKSIRSAATLP